jgi:hypothetical protein
MQPNAEANTWLFVVQRTHHLEHLRVGDQSWWCVDRNCRPGQKAFLYQRKKGVVFELEILELLESAEQLCKAYQMNTARVRILSAFVPPITSKALKGSRVIRNERFVRLNFQGKSFSLESRDTAPAILALARKVAPALATTNGDPKAPHT